MLTLAVVVPICWLCGYGYVDYQRREAVASDYSDHLAQVAEEQALKVMDLNAELVSRVQDLLDDSRAEEIRRKEAALHDKLDSIAGGFPQVAAVSAVGSDGEVLVSSRFYPVPRVNLRTREDFIAAERYRPQPYISGPMNASVTGTNVFNVAEARTAADGRFLGTVTIALRVDYFEGFYRTLVQPGAQHFVALVRRDGVVLADGPTAMAATSLGPSTLADGLKGSGGAARLTGTDRTDGRDLHVVYRQVGDYGLYVVAGYRPDGLFGQWLQHLMLLTCLAAIPCVAVWSLILFSLRQLRTEESGWHHWRSEASRRIAAEASGRQLQRMGALGNLVANVAHAFNNHLMVVKANLALARQKSGQDVDAEVTAIERTTDSVQALVRTLMGATKKQPLTLRKVDLREVLPGLAALAQTAVGDSVLVRVQRRDDVWMVRCDSAELELAIFNLALNARDAMPEGGELTLRADNINVVRDKPTCATGAVCRAIRLG
ncbi:cache domain-containing protein [Paraburkholderia strydomiana]|uniref:cache domain-containing protein n=1 Tax=Paraburkholderia strydomiana TaxID=1245417 RepID=UPI0038B983DD